MKQNQACTSDKECPFGKCLCSGNSELNGGQCVMDTYPIEDSLRTQCIKRKCGYEFALNSFTEEEGYRLDVTSCTYECNLAYYRSVLTKQISAYRKVIPDYNIGTAVGFSLPPQPS